MAWSETDAALFAAVLGRRRGRRSSRLPFGMELDTMEPALPARLLDAMELRLRPLDAVEVRSRHRPARC